MIAPSHIEPAASRFLAPLLPALRRLDKLIERATAAADAAYGVKAATDSYRGLYISAEDVGRLLARDPGVPALVGGDASDSGDTGDLADASSSGAAALEAIPAESRFRRLESTFELIDFELDVLLIALAPEIDLRYERLFAYLQDDVTRKRPSVDLALNLLCATREAKFAARARFLAGAPLIKERLLTLVPDNAATPGPLLSHTLRLDDVVARFLLGHDTMDERWQTLIDVTPDVPAPSVEALDEALVTRLQVAAREASAMPLTLSPHAGRGDRQADGPLRLYLQGGRGSGKRLLAEVIAAAADSPLMTIDAARLTEASASLHDLDVALRAALRDARLRGAAVYVTGLDALRSDRKDSRESPAGASAGAGIGSWIGTAPLHALRSVLRDFPGVLVLSGEKPWIPALLPSGPALDATTVQVTPPGYDARLDRWRERAEAAGFDLADEEASELASRFQLSLEQIDAAVSWAAGERRLGGDPRPDFFTASRVQSSHDLGALARKITPNYTWDDIVLPADQAARLREMCAQARYRHVVYGEWGFGRKLSLGKGLSALFSGPPGTGKTMAAEVIARELRLDVYKIDLSQVVSKYIGETEKNLNRIFAEARASNAIIFFDEADALFGRRSEVKDAHDRYANIEVAYLLQKMDEYDGVSILATNLRQNLDPAFTRRLSFTIEFPFPDEQSRRQIWQTIWPDARLLAEDADLDFMATQFKLSGGSVKNIAVAAAFLAAEDGRRVTLTHLLRATKREYEKQGRTVSRSEFGRHAARLE